MDARALLRATASRIPPSWLASIRYRDEHRFVRGRLVLPETQPSVVFFTVRKCASTFTKRLLARINARHLKLTHLNLAGYLWDTRDEGGYRYLSEHAHRLLRDHGALYAPLRGWLDTSHLRHARVLAMLRDPRDMVVSGYYSARYSHREPANAAKRAQFLDNRQRVRQMSIDEYALDYAPKVAHIFDAYRAGIGRDRVLTYEQMWWDFDGFCRRLGDLLEIDLGADEVAQYRSTAGVDRRNEENQTLHRRTGTPGDHRRKLSPDTVRELDRCFGGILDWLNTA